jgi:hypothetical protein
MSLTIIGRGEVARVFERCAKARDEEVRIVVRGEDPSARALADGPVVVAVREEDLGALIAPLRPIAERCVFPQNGWIDPLLAPLGRITRGLLWFTAKGELFRDLIPSVFYGPYAEEMVRLFAAGSVSARVNVVGLPLAVRKLTLAEYLVTHADEARAIMDETCKAFEAELGIAIDPDATYKTLLDTTTELGGLRGGKKALDVRNGAVVRLAETHGLDAPVNAKLMSMA